MTLFHQPSKSINLEPDLLLLNGMANGGRSYSGYLQPPWSPSPPGLLLSLIPASQSSWWCHKPSAGRRMSLPGIWRRNSRWPGVNRWWSKTAWALPVCVGIKTVLAPYKAIAAAMTDVIGGASRYSFCRRAFSLATHQGRQAAGHWRIQRQAQQQYARRDYDR